MCSGFFKEKDPELREELTKKLATAESNFEAQKLRHKRQVLKKRMQLVESESSGGEEQDEEEEEQDQDELIGGTGAEEVPALILLDL